MDLISSHRSSQVPFGGFHTWGCLPCCVSGPLSLWRRLVTEKRADIDISRQLSRSNTESQPHFLISGRFLESLRLFGHILSPLRPRRSCLRCHQLPRQALNFEKREVVFSQQVPVEERNAGVIIVHQYMGEPGTTGQEIVRYDDYVRNQEWRHLGPILPTAEELAARMQVQQQMLEKRGAGYRSPPSVWDVAPKGGKASKAQRVNPFSDKARLSATGEYVARVLKSETQFLDWANRSEFLDEKGLQNFFSSPEAVSYEETPSV
eukprot:s206_g19.t1